MAPTPSLNLGRSFGWMFKSPNWVTNLVWATLCVLLGSLVVGQLVLVGYQMEIIQRRSRGGENDYVDFDPNRFIDYLVRGLIPAAVYLVVGLGFSALIGMIMFVWAAVFGAIMGPNPQDLTVLIMLLPLVGLGLVQACGVLFVAVPLALRAGLANDFSEGLKFKWALNTASMMWPVILLALLYVIMGSFVSMIGILFCFVGLFVTSAWLQLVLADLGAQLVDIYLSKGGSPVPMHGETLQAEVI